MRLSDEKVSHISHLLIEGLTKDNLAKFPNKTAVLNATKKIITNYCKLDDEIDDVVRKKLKSYSRNILEGSREWDVLYKKHFDEEMKKR